MIFLTKRQAFFSKKGFGLQNQTEVPANRTGTSTPLLAIARNEEEYNSIEIGAILQYADEQIEVVGKWHGRLLYNSYAEPTGKPVFPKDMKFYYNYKYLDGKGVDKPKRFVIPKDE